MIYLHEAHADDVWPMGYGITNPRTTAERWSRFDDLMKRFPKLEEKIQYRFVDNMDNDFNSATGAWPESYYFADKDGKALFGTNHLDNNTSHAILQNIEQFAENLLKTAE